MADKFSTCITREIRNNDDEIDFHSLEIHGYDIFNLSMAGYTSTDILFLHLKGELPDKTQSELFRVLSILFSNLGNYHAAMRAAVAIGSCRSAPENHLPSAICIASGSVGGGKEVINVMKCFKDNKDTSFFLSGNSYSERQLKLLSNLEGAGKALKYLSNQNRCVSSTTIFGATLCDLGFHWASGSGIFQYICSPGLLSHSIEAIIKPSEQFPMIVSHQNKYQIVNQQTKDILSNDLDVCRNKIITTIGGYQSDGSVLSHGKCIIKDCIMKDWNWFKLFLWNITGKEYPESIVKFLEKTWMGMSYPDPSIWNNMIAAFGGTTYCEPNAALAAATLTNDAILLSGAVPFSIQFMKTALNMVKNGKTIEEIIESHPKKNGIPAIMGYVRPAGNKMYDERITAVEIFRKKIELNSDWSYLNLGFQIHEYMKTKYKRGMNFAGYLACTFTDLNFSENIIKILLSPMATSGFLACFNEWKLSPSNSFYILGPEDIEYNGVESRLVPYTKGFVFSSKL